MGSKLYVGNLSYETTELSVQEFFSQCGKVTEVVLIQNPATGRSRGFAFVTMSSDAEAQAAISAINGKEFEGRPLVVNEAKPRESSSSQGGGSFARPRRHNSSSRPQDRRGGGNRHRRED